MNKARTHQLVLRLAAPLQSWGVYRVSTRRVTTLPVPSKTGVAGLLGACLGERDHRTLAGSFDLDVRVDRTNPFVTDLQVAVGPRSGRDEESWERAVLVGTPLRPHARTPLPSRADIDNRYVIGGGTLHEVSERDYIPHAEFLVALSGTEGDVVRWYEAARRPAHMPYLGRRSAAPEFPFVLGVAEVVDDVLAHAPRVISPTEPATASAGVPVYRMAGDVTTLPVPRNVPAPFVSTREEYLAWFSQHLTR